MCMYINTHTYVYILTKLHYSVSTVQAGFCYEAGKKLRAKIAWSLGGLLLSDGRADHELSRRICLARADFRKTGPCLQAGGSQHCTETKGIRCVHHERLALWFGSGLGQCSRATAS